MEKYPRGRRGSPAKGVVRDTVARVQIPLSPPQIADERSAICAPLAQLDRALVYGTKGQEFESLTTHQIITENIP